MGEVIIDKEAGAVIFIQDGKRRSFTICYEDTVMMRYLVGLG